MDIEAESSGGLGGESAVSVVDGGEVWGIRDLRLLQKVLSQPFAMPAEVGAWAVRKVVEAMQAKQKPRNIYAGARCLALFARINQQQEASDNPATVKHEHIHAVVSVDDLRTRIAGFLDSALERARVAGTGGDLGDSGGATGPHVVNGHPVLPAHSNGHPAGGSEPGLP